MSVDVIKSKNKNIELDKTSNRLKKYPKYAESFGTLSIPKIDVKLDITEGDSLKILKYSLGHYEGSYFPGENGTIIVAGHNTTKFLYNLPKVKKGYIVNINTIYGDFKYKVYKTDIIKNTDVKKLEVQDKEEILMLYTCYPVDTIGFKDHRFVIYASKEVE